jgi:hypothetical protein
MKGAVFQLDAIGLAAMEKSDCILVDKRHVPQIQNELLPGCLNDDQLSKLLDIVRCFDPAAKREQNSSILSSPSSQHASPLACLVECMTYGRKAAWWPSLSH